ncbi:MAG: hypothetical protein ACXWUP_09930 [Allosphingosinicella sp.]
MSIVLNEQSRRLLAQSLPLLQSNRDPIAEAMEVSLAAAAEPGEAFGQAEVTAMILLELLLAQGRALAETGHPLRVEGTLDEHRALDIGGRHYSRFGDSLVAILRDVLGPGLPREVAAAWCDAFWSVVHAVTATRETARA